MSHGGMTHGKASTHPAMHPPASALYLETRGRCSHCSNSVTALVPECRTDAFLGGGFSHLKAFEKSLGIKDQSSPMLPLPHKAMR